MTKKMKKKKILFMTLGRSRFARTAKDATAVEASFASKQKVARKLQAKPSSAYESVVSKSYALFMHAINVVLSSLYGICVPLVAICV